MIPSPPARKIPEQAILWITDPWDTLAHSNDTTLRLMNEAHKMGIATYWSASDFILRPLNPSRVLVERFSGERSTNPIEMDLSKFHHLHYRIDPPVDFNYISLLDQLEARIQATPLTETPPPKIMNPTAVLKHQSEKVPPPELKHLTPRLIEVTQKADLAVTQELFKNHDRIVTKPMNTAQSIGVKKWETPKNEVAWFELLSGETRSFSQPILVEEYLPAVDSGEVRMWFADGEFIAALKKYPKSGDFRVLIDEGSRVTAHSLDSTEQAAAAEVGKSLKAKNVALAAIDFIGGKISDYNITSPGLLVQLEAVHKKNFARVILEILYGKH